MRGVFAAMPSVQTSVVREVKINAKPETVFSYLVDESKLRRWLSSGGAWKPRPGEAFRLQITSGDWSAGKFVEVKPPSKVVFTFGWEAEDFSIKPGASTVEITVQPDGDGTLVRLTHSGIPTQESAEKHGHGWEHYLERLAIAATGKDPGPDSFQE
jgi:uncharacterized protein YndB with AHSA1/START domain